MPLPLSTNQLNEVGWAIDIFPDARKSCDVFANLKSSNYLPYVMADLFSTERGLNECLVLNVENNICDASKANVFLLINGNIYTPPLHQGCINGVKRRYVIEELKKRGTVVYQKEISERHLLIADEVFLTNAINDIRWVASYRGKQCGNSFISAFYNEVFSTIY
jgi:branched-chain amino acid aminotransferase